MDDIAGIGGNVILATPSGARPAWLSEKYPEVLRTNERREKQLHGGRHNHCFSSPVYREKVGMINAKLAERYGDHKALLMWHVSNEYSGDCHCELCRENFRTWLQQKYKTIENLNKTWWAPFWSHTYNNFAQVDPPSPIGESAVHGLNMDWKRFVTDQTIDFFLHECKPLRELTPNIDITTNFMGDPPNASPFTGLDYSKFAKDVDIISWDAYPPWHNDYESMEFLASKVGMINDYFRTLKDKPFLIMECTPSQVNWMPVNKAKRPGMHILSSIAMLAHGSDSILYFQWRKSKGSSEKLHGAVVDHDNSSGNRVFKEVAQLGGILEKLQEIKGANKNSKVAILFDTENKWTLDDAQGFAHGSKNYTQTLHAHYKYFWDNNISVDVVTKDKEFDKYDLLVAPMLYMIDADLMTKLQTFVSNGGKLVSTYITGVVDENDLVHLGGWPPILRETFGINVLETDTLYPNDSNIISAFNKEYRITDYCAIIESANAKTLGTYKTDFYQNTPAVTANSHGKGIAYFIAAGTGQDFLKDFYDHLCKACSLTLVIKSEPGISIQVREGEKHRYHFVMNFSEEEKQLAIEKDIPDMITGKTFTKGKHQISKYGVCVFKEDK